MLMTEFEKPEHLSRNVYHHTEAAISQHPTPWYLSLADTRGVISIATIIELLSVQPNIPYTK